MIQYKLIKEYPGGPKLPFASNERHSNFKGFEYYDSFPDFWQKVEELDYEILSVISNDKIVISKSGYTYPECFQTLLDQKDDFDIHSVKRILDGEVFTIGDLIDYKDFGNKGIQPIGKFEIDDFDNTRITAWDGAYGIGLLIWKKKSIKTSLFTTEDGVDIFDKNQKVFSVSECEFSIQNHQDFAWIKSRSPQRKYHNFSTKENAAEYILLNKPCLSLNDLLSVWGDNSQMEYYKTAPMFNDFKKLAKSKL